MRDSRFSAWFMACLWATWIAAAQGFCAGVMGGGLTALWLPDFLVVLLLAWCARLDEGVLPGAIALVLAARLAFSGDPPLAIAFGVLTLGGGAALLRGVAEASAPLLRTMVAALGAFGLAAWLIVVARLRDGAHAPALEIWAALPCALSSGVFAFACGPLFARLPGIAALHEERW